MKTVLAWSWAGAVLLVLWGAGCGRNRGTEDAGDADVAVQAEEVQFVGTARPREVDIYSGDVRGERYRADGSSVYGIYESELSKEVRRLGMAIPEERKWFRIAPASSGRSGFYVTYVYANLLPTARRLLERLDDVDATDAERRDVLERFMTSLRTERPPSAIHMGRMLIVEVGDRHGYKSPYLPGYTEDLREASRERAPSVDR